VHLVCLIIRIYHDAARSSDCQKGIPKGTFCTDPTLYFKILIEKRREYNLETHLLFRDDEKAFDIV
jgi:hypothetical protein